MTAEAMQFFIMIVTLVLVVYSIWKSRQNGETISLEGLLDEIEEAQPLALEIAAAAEMAVQAAEHLKQTGDIASNDEAFNYVIDQLQSWYPDLDVFDNEQVITAINYAVHGANYMTAQIRLAKDSAEKSRLEAAKELAQQHQKR